MIENWQRAGFGLYFHWPFCQAKCPYCDFNSHVRAEIDQTAWTNAFLSEIDRAADLTEGRTVATVFFGGGTPSLMDPETVADILARVKDRWAASNTIEVTLEANPTSVEAQRFSGYRDAGVNRVSVGVQALDDDHLRQLGRLHSVDEALNAVELARATFDRMSFDLIYARQGQSLDMWAQELDRCLGMKPDHLSLYQLTIEDGTAFGALHKAGKLRGLPDEDLAADMYDLTQELTGNAGLAQYEISNHASPENEARHNQIYWRGGDWAGIGPGAHGRLTLASGRLASITPMRPEDWLGQANGQQGATRYDPLEGPDVAMEYVLMALRMSEGLDLSHLKSLDPGLHAAVTSRTLEGDLPLETDEGKLRLRPEGRIVMNAVLGQLVRDSA